MKQTSLVINTKIYQIDADPDMPLLWVIRDLIGLTGTKYGCGVGSCGACTIHIDGEATRSCLIPVSAAQNKKITTIEGLTELIGESLKKAWKEEDVPQCGYCQAGQLMNATAFIRTNPKPTDDEISEAMNGNYCRCGTYLRILKAIKKVTNQN
jgi:isoquinoline 1-oxidoreductase subunit alpha